MTAAFAKIIPLRREGVAIAELSDEALIAACATGDRAARAALFERYVDFVHRFVARLSTADRDSVDDLIQSTFLEAFRAAASFRGGSQVRTWLCGIAVNVTRNYARSEKRRKAMLGNAVVVAESEVRWAASASLSAEQRQALQKIAEALPKLSTELREAFVLCDLEGMKGSQAAEVLGVPEGTIWRRLHDARLKLRAALVGER